MEQDKIEFQHATPVQVRFNDIDLMGHVNNATIQEYFDLGRMHYLRDVFDDQLFRGEDTLIIASIATDFAVPVMLHDQVEVKTTIIHIGNKSLKMVQHLVDAQSGTLKAMCRSVMVGVHKKTATAIPIVQEWRERIAKMEKKDF